jgi:urocanate hydratase
MVAVGWGEVINGGFGMVLDGSKEASKRIESMLFWDVNNGFEAIVTTALFAIKEQWKHNLLKVTLPNIVADNLLILKK